MGVDVCAQMRNRARSSGQRHVFIVNFWPQLALRDSRCPREAVDISRVGHPFGGPRPYEGSDRYTLRIAAPVILCVPSRTRVPVSTPKPLAIRPDSPISKIRRSAPGRSHRPYPCRVRPLFGSIFGEGHRRIARCPRLTLRVGVFFRVRVRVLIVARR